MQRLSIVRHFRRAGLCLVLGTLAASASLASAEQTYPIRLHVNRGDKWSFDSTTSMSEKGQVLANGALFQPIEQAFTQRRKGTVEVMAMENGLPAAMRITYDAESSNGGGAGAQDPPPFKLAGRTVNVSRKDGIVTSDLGNDIDTPTVQEVSHMLDPDTAIYPKDPVAVNQEWEGDAAVIAKAYQLGPDDKITVKCKLLEVHDVGGKKVAEVGISVTMMKHDQGLTETRALDGTSRIDIETGQATETALSGKITVRGTQQTRDPNGAPVKIDVTADGTMKIQSTARPLNAAAPVAQGTGFGVANPPAPQEPLPTGNGAFTGRYKGDQVALDLSDADGKVTGTLTVGEKKFPLAGKSDGGKLTGNFESDGTKFDFTASLQGGTLTLTSEGNTYTLKKPAANPLAKPAAQNPLSKPEPKNPLAE